MRLWNHNFINRWFSCTCQKRDIVNLCMIINFLNSTLYAMCIFIVKTDSVSSVSLSGCQCGECSDVAATENCQTGGGCVRVCVCVCVCVGGGGVGGQGGGH